MTELEITPPLHMRVRLMDLAAVKEMLRDSRDVNVADRNGDTALMFAAQGSNVEMVRTLLKAGSRVNAKNASGIDAMVHAINNAQGAPIITALLQFGADPNGETARGPHIGWAFYNGSRHPGLWPNFLTLFRAGAKLPDWLLDDLPSVVSAKYAFDEALMQTLVEQGREPALRRELRKNKEACPAFRAWMTRLTAQKALNTLNIKPLDDGPPPALPKTIEHLLGKLSQHPWAERIQVFGSVGRGDASPRDLDIVVNFRDRSIGAMQWDQPLHELIRLAKKHYGWLDPFLNYRDALVVRNDNATSWIRSNNVRAMRANMKRDGVPLAQVVARHGIVADADNKPPSQLPSP
jgi:hypothetical protein